jgi:hypothetical protein
MRKLKAVFVAAVVLTGGVALGTAGAAAYIAVTTPDSIQTPDGGLTGWGNAPTVPPAPAVTTSAISPIQQGQAGNPPTASAPTPQATATSPDVACIAKAEANRLIDEDKQYGPDGGDGRYDHTECKEGWAVAWGGSDGRALYKLVEGKWALEGMASSWDADYPEFCGPQSTLPASIRTRLC